MLTAATARREIAMIVENANDYADCSFNLLCDLHDSAVECDDYSRADRIASELTARPEYPAYQAIIAKLTQEFQPEQSFSPF